MLFKAELCRTERRKIKIKQFHSEMITKESTNKRKLCVWTEVTNLFAMCGTSIMKIPNDIRRICTHSLALKFTTNKKKKKMKKKREKKRSIHDAMK